jgi:hypothetical protein
MLARPFSLIYRPDPRGRRIEISKFMGNRALAVMHGVLTHLRSPLDRAFPLASGSPCPLSGKPQRGRKRNFTKFLVDIAS